MTVKEAVLQTLEQSRGERLSGAMLADRLGVSRAAVNKAVSALRAEGLHINAVPGGGYLLEEDDDSLTAAGVQALLNTAYIGRRLQVEPELSSTNTVMKNRYLHEANGFTLIAEQQTGGRGRMGRSFASPAGTGIYLTILLHPTLPIERIHFVTIAAAVAVAQAIAQTAGFEPQIKWVNDVLMNGRKLCGILTEATIEGETAAISSLIVGIGINLRPNPLWPEEVKNVAGALSDFATPPRRAALCAAVLSHVERTFSLLENGQETVLLNAYRSRLCCLDKPVTVISAAGQYRALCTGLNTDGHLIVRTDNGEIRTLSSGEISIRL